MKDINPQDSMPQQISTEPTSEYRPWINRAKGAGVAAVGFCLGYGGAEIVDRVTDIDLVIFEKFTLGSLGSMATSLIVVSAMTRRMRS